MPRTTPTDPPVAAPRTVRSQRIAKPKPLAVQSPKDQNSGVHRGRR